MSCGKRSVSGIDAIGSNNRWCLSTRAAMGRANHCMCLGAFLACFACAAESPNNKDAPTTETSGSPLAVKDSTQMPAVKRHHGAKSLAEDSAAIVRARVTAMDARAFDARLNAPFTKVLLEVLEVISGEVQDKRIEMHLRGGLHPDGNLEWFHEVPMLTEGNTYVLFLRGGEWDATPFADMRAGALRESVADGKPVLVDADGKAMTEFDDERINFGKKVVASEFVEYTTKLGWSFQDASSEGLETDSKSDSLAPTERTAAYGYIRELTKRVARPGNRKIHRMPRGK